MAKPRNFKRIVLGLQASVTDGTMHLATELANLLHLDLLGLFPEDTSLRHLVNMPFAREFRPLGGGWHPIDMDQWSHELGLTSRRLERKFAEATKGLSGRRQFATIEGPTIETITSISRTDDIIMIIEPANPAERVTQQFSWLIEAAFQSAAAVMLVPRQIARTAGPVVAILVAPDDPSLDAAAAIAIAAQEELILIEATKHALNHTRIRKLVTETGLTIKPVVAGSIAFSDPSALCEAFSQVKERLLVMQRGVFDAQLAFIIASLRRVPVLITEPLDIRVDATPSDADVGAAEREQPG